MQVKVVHGLPAVRACVEHNAIAAVEPGGARDFGRLGKQVAQQRRLRRSGLRQRRDVLPGNDQQMGRRLGPKIGEAEAQLVLEDALGRDTAGNDLAEETIGAHTETLTPIYTDDTDQKKEMTNSPRFLNGDRSVHPPL
jgi:hypothetical protein